MGLLVTALASTTNIILGVIVYYSNPKSATNKLLSFLALQIAIWSVVNYLSLNQATEQATLFWIRLDMIPGAPMGPTMYLLVRSFPHEKLNASKKMLISLALLVVTTSIFAMSPYMFTEVIFEGDNIKAIPGPAILLFGLNFIGGLLLTFIITIKKYRKSSGLEKSQLKYLLFGLLVTFSLIAVTQFLFVIFLGRSDFILFGPLYSIILVGSISYAIVKHQFLDIRVIATEALTVVLSIVLFSRIFSSGTTPERIVDIAIFVTVLIFGALLVRSVQREVEQRRQLQILNDKLEALDARKDEFINVAAHELRAPMTAIKGYISMIVEGDVGKVPKKVNEYLESVVEANDRLIRLVNNMLNVSRIEEGRQVFNMGDVNLAKVTQTTFTEFEANAKENGLGFKLSIPEGIKDLVYVDTDRIHEVVANLISNAIKYTDEGEINIKLTQPTPQSIKFEVADTGAGLSPEEQQKVFTKFYRAESNVGKVMGTGLGLYISKLLVEQFNGKLGLSSEKEKGSTFWFELPLKQQTN